MRLGAKTGERAIEEIATGAGVPRELSATYPTEWGFVVGRIGRTRRREESRHYSTRDRDPSSLSCHRQCPPASQPLTSTTRHNVYPLSLRTTTRIALGTVSSFRFPSSRPVSRFTYSRPPTSCSCLATIYKECTLGIPIGIYNSGILLQNDSTTDQAPVHAHAAIGRTRVILPQCPKNLVSPPFNGSGIEELRDAVIKGRI